MSITEQYDDRESPFGGVISMYTRAQAIEDGELHDLSAIAKEAGFKFPVAVSKGVWAILAPWDNAQQGDISKPLADQPLFGLGQSIYGRAWDMLTILMWEIKRGDGGSRVDFAPLFLMGHKWTQDKPMPVPMYALCGPGDDARPVITIMMPTED